jgi:hypothetical protein
MREGGSETDEDEPNIVFVPPIMNSLWLLVSLWSLRDGLRSGSPSQMKFCQENNAIDQVKDWPYI